MLRRNNEHSTVRWVPPFMCIFFCVETSPVCGCVFHFIFFRDENSIRLLFVCFFFFFDCFLEARPPPCMFPAGPVLIVALVKGIACFGGQFNSFLVILFSLLFPLFFGLLERPHALFPLLPLGGKDGYPSGWGGVLLRSWCKSVPSFSPLSLQHSLTQRPLHAFLCYFLFSGFIVAVVVLLSGVGPVAPSWLFFKCRCYLPLSFPFFKEQRTISSDYIQRQLLHMSEFDELFSFLESGVREDVRRMAMEGLAAMSKDNQGLVQYVATHSNSVTLLVDLMTVSNASLLGNLLSLLTNLSIESRIAEALVQQRIVTKCMRLLDALERSGLAAERTLAYKELALMLLNNLTATHISAVNELLQADDEELIGYNLAKLKTLHDRIATGEAQKEQVAPADEPSNAAPAKAQPGRDMRLWYLRIVLNATRVPTGQRQLLEDDEWAAFVLQLLADHDAARRAIATQICRNCAAVKDNHPKFVERRFFNVILERLCCSTEETPTNVVMYADILSVLAASEAGMTQFESLNAKKLLQEAIAGKLAGNEAAKKILEEQVLPFLDEIQDAYVMSNNDTTD